MRKIGLAIWLSFLLTTTVIAAEAESFVVLGHGNKICSQVLSNYDEAGVERVANNIWVNGYLTAENARAKTSDITKGMSQDNIERRILAYCSKHPGHSLVDAVAHLVRSLP